MGANRDEVLRAPGRRARRLRHRMDFGEIVAPRDRASGRHMVGNEWARVGLFAAVTNVACSTKQIRQRQVARPVGLGNALREPPARVEARWRRLEQLAVADAYNPFNLLVADRRGGGSRSDLRAASAPKRVPTGQLGHRHRERSDPLEPPTPKLRAVDAIRRSRIAREPEARRVLRCARAKSVEATKVPVTTRSTDVVRTRRPVRHAQFDIGSIREQRSPKTRRATSASPIRRSL